MNKGLIASVSLGELGDLGCNHCSLNVIVIVFLLVRSGLLITLVTCLKGQKSVRVLCSNDEGDADKGD